VLWKDRLEQLGANVQTETDEAAQGGTVLTQSDSIAILRAGATKPV
jgi:hypothetical protein